MSRYTPGDVLIVPFPFTGESGPKLRPALVLRLDRNGDPVCSPIRSSPRAGTSCVPIGIDDFATGGLDLFAVSFVQTDTVLTVQSRAVSAKKGSVTPEFLQGIVGSVTVLDPG